MDNINHGANAPEFETTLIPGKDAADSTVLSTGATLGPYQILGKLGEGGMGAVYKARHSRLDKMVAIKVLSAAVTHEPEAIARFEREMKAVGKLNHPNIVQAYDAGEVNGTHYLAMEYIDGTDLKKLVNDRGPMSVVNACKAIRQAALALASAHEAGLVHRDIKPSNLLLTKSGQIKLLDLGLARLAGEAATNSSDLTTEGESFGTPDYMAPEQWEDAHSADARTDLYALGCTLFFLLTGRTPFGSDAHRTAANKMKSHLMDPVPDLHAAREDAPQDLDAIYRKLMAKKPEDRFQSAMELAEALTPFSSTKSSAGTAPADAIPATAPVVKVNEPTSPPSVPQAGSRSGQAGGTRRFYQLAGGAAAFIVLLGVIVITITGKDGQKTTVKIPEGTPVEVDPAPGSKVSITQAPESDTSVIPEAVVDAPRNLAIRLTPGAYVEIPSLKLDPAAPCTIEAWATPLDANHADKHVAGWPGPCSLYVSRAELNWSFGLSRNGGPFQFLLSPAPAVLDRRIHLAAVRTGQEFRLFVDGQRVGSSPEHANPLVDQRAPFSLSSSRLPFSGDYDEVRVSRVARYDESFTPKIRWEPDADTLALYHCDENGGEQLVDSSSQKHHGQIFGPATWLGIDQAAKSEDAPKPAVATFDAPAAKAHQDAWAKHLGVSVESTNSIGIKMILIPPGEFLMGADEADTDAAPHEKPQHQVRLTKPFAIGATEVTNRQFHEFIKATQYVTQAESDGQGAFEVNQKIRQPSNTWNSPETRKKSGDDHPVRCVSWEDARRFCEWLTQTEGQTYRLPTEAEWEFACRAGTATRYSFGNHLSDSPSPPGTSGAALREVAQLPANPFGLFDMHGNVNEFCLDSGRTYTAEPVTDPRGSLEIDRPAAVRGGAISSHPARLRSSNRYLNDARQFPEINFATTVLGFRVVREIASSPPTAKAPFEDQQARAHQEAWAAHLKLPVESTNSVGMKFQLIPPGEFLMGSTDEQVTVAHRLATEAKAMSTVLERIQLAERPQHRVVISRPFLIGSMEVTNADFQKFVEATQYVTEAEQFGFGDDGEKQLTDKVTEEQKKLTWRAPGYEVTEQHPVSQVSWNDGIAYCRWLSTQEQAVYRLPTEAEWEYACRAGTTTHYSFSDDEQSLEKFGWYGLNAQGRPEVVGAKLANGFGLHDMHGNLFEWCQDIFDEAWYQRTPTFDPVGPVSENASGTYYVVRGGFWGGSAPLCRSAFRINHSAAYRHRSGGFRVVREITQEAKPE
jgi:formylglycine-generating enzyme required for sulfatase activity/serine/threonine protein kinase